MEVAEAAPMGGRDVNGVGVASDVAGGDCSDDEEPAAYRPCVHQTSMTFHQPSPSQSIPSLIECSTPMGWSVSRTSSICMLSKKESFFSLLQQ